MVDLLRRWPWLAAWIAATTYSALPRRVKPLRRSGAPRAGRPLPRGDGVIYDWPTSAPRTLPERGRRPHMSHDLVIRSGTVITATDRFVADLGIRAGRIVEIGESLPRASQEIDATGLLVMPGGVDVHTHLDVDVGAAAASPLFAITRGSGAGRRSRGRSRRGRRRPGARLTSTTASTSSSPKSTTHTSPRSLRSSRPATRASRSS